MREILRVDENNSSFLLDGLHIAWETAKKNPAYYETLEKKYLSTAYRQMLIRYANQSDNIAIVSKTMEAMQDSLIITDSLRAEAQVYLLQYLYKYGVKRYQDQLLPVLGAVIWFKPSGDSIAAKLTEIMNTAANEWGNKQIADSAYKALIIMGKKVPPPDVKIIRQPINWDEIERMPDTLALQSRFGFIFIKLNTYEAPLSALNICHLAKGSYFVFNYIHRLVPNFVVQTGDLTGTGYGGPGYTIRTEIAPIRYDSLGVCGMASDGKDTEGSQWFITHCPTPHLNTRYTIWGEVAIGKETVELFQWNDKIDNMTPYR
jgi:cyclophilin family peptidyl-prolyl cis-trans isomerase